MTPPNKVPHAHIDAGSRLVQITQPHPILVDNAQTVTISFAMLKSLVGQLLQIEAQAEAITGDPRATPPNPGDNGGRVGIIP